MKAIRPRRVDLATLKLTPEEGFVLSRIVGPLALHELVAISSLEEARVVAIVERLASAGAIDIDGRELPAAPPPPPFRAPAPSFSGIDELEAIGEGAASPEAARGHALAIAGASHPGHVRANNEDAFAAVDLTDGGLVDVSTSRGAALDPGARGVLLAVADGMGGANAGEVASRTVVDALRKRVSASDARVEPAESLREAVEAANAGVLESAAWPGCEGMGATVIAVLVRDGVAYTAEVGDSRAYVLRSGALTQISKDQTYTALLVEQGVLSADDARKSRAKHVVLQACGRAPEVVVAQRAVALRSGDVLLLCSDGLSGQVDDGAIAAILRDAGSPADACAKLVAAANARGGEDNVTVVVARIGGLDLPTTHTVAAATRTIREFAFPT